MKYSLVILGAPYASLAPLSALNFAKAALSEGHEIFRVFFYEDAVQIASIYAQPPRDEINLRKEWEKLKQQHHLDLVICIAESVKRGLLNEDEAIRYELDGTGNISDAFELSGLGQLVEASELSDRVITFS